MTTDVTIGLALYELVGHIEDKISKQIIRDTYAVVVFRAFHHFHVTPIACVRTDVTVVGSRHISHDRMCPSLSHFRAAKSKCWPDLCGFL